MYIQLLQVLSHVCHLPLCWFSSFFVSSDSYISLTFSSFHIFSYYTIYFFSCQFDYGQRYCDILTNVSVSVQYSPAFLYIVYSHIVQLACSLLPLDIQYETHFRSVWKAKQVICHTKPLILPFNICSIYFQF